MKTPITILIAEDHVLIREAWKLILDEDPRFTVCGSCHTGEEAVQLALQLAPDIVLMDINLPGMDGLRATKEIHGNNPAIKIIGLSMHSELALVKKMMSAGASAYITKNSGTDELFTAISHVQNSGRYICKEIHEELSDRFTETGNETRSSKLTMREAEIVRCVRQGFSSKEIATMLGLSKKTVERHRYNIMKKLNVHNTASLVHYINRHSNAVIL